MGPEKEPAKNNKSQSDEIVRLIVGVGGLFGFILSLLGTLISIIDWASARKIVLGVILFLIWLFVEFLFWKQRQKRSSKKKLPWLISLFVDVAKDLDPDSIKDLKNERIFQILRWTAISLMATILLASAINLSEIKLTDMIDPPTPTPTFTQTPSNTPTPTFTFTTTPIPTSTPEEQGIYYMFVLDASLKMQEEFETQTKWDAALRAVDGLLVGFEDGANYGMVAIGGSPGAGSTNPCSIDSLSTLPFSTKEAVGKQVSELQPGGGGSLYQAFVVAKNQFDSLPKNTVHTLVYITGSEDACESEDEWANLERYFKAKGDDGLNIYSEIIIIDNGLRSQTIAEHISSISTKVNAQAPQTVFQVLQSNLTVITNVNNYIDITVAAIPTNTPTSIPIITPTKTADAIIVALPAIATSITPSRTLTPTWTPSLTPSFTLTPSLSPTPTPNVELTGFEYVGTGEYCQALISFQVSGSPATGYFRVWNQWYADNNLPYDSGYAQITLPVGPNGYQIGLGGNGNPAYYRHKVWFEYNGTNSNVLDLICPNLTPSP